MSSRLMVNLIEPSDIVIPDTDGGTPDTGIFSIGQGTNNVQNSNALIITVISLAVLLAIVTVIILLIKRHKKQKLVNKLGGSYNGMTLNTKRHLVPRLAGLFTLVLIAAFGFLSYNEKHMTSNVEAANNTLTVTTEDITAIDIEVEDEAVFGMGETKVTVTTATDNGYTLMAYVDSSTTSLTNTESDDVIEMLETSYSQALTDNTWGISLTRPESQEQTIFRGLPTTEEDAMVVKVSGSDATEANDETTLYYGTYVTPDLEYGTYDGVTINYVAVAHVIDTDDITLRFHGNGFYFDEAKTKDTNTVVYGTSCEMFYVGGNCRKVYTTEQPHTIVKTSNILDDGTQDGAYPIDEIYQSISIPGADAIKIEVNYAISDQQGSVGLDMARGVLDYNDFRYDAEIYTGYGDYAAGEETFVFDSDAATILFWASSEPIEDYDYGFYARVYPIYYEQPESVNTIEDTLCYIVKSKNIDDDGNATGLYEYENWITKPITIPGATHIKVEIDYALTEEAEIEIVEGFEHGDWNSWEDLYAYNENISGTKELFFDGDTVTFDYGFWDEPVEGYGYGFFAKLYPAYDEEQEGTVPAQNCAFGIKDGAFEEFVVPDDYPFPDKQWYLIVEIEGEDYYGQPRMFYGQFRMLDYIMARIDYYAGRIVDIYAAGYRIINYDANGGVPSYDDWEPVWNRQWIGEFDGNRSIWNSDYLKKDGYVFVGWNTRPDGNGDWYYPDDPISAEGHLGETLTLYAQWESD